MVGQLHPVQGVDPVLLILEALDQCPDEYLPPSTTAELTFIPDDVDRVFDQSGCCVFG